MNKPGFITKSVMIAGIIVIAVLIGAFVFFKTKKQRGPGLMPLAEDFSCPVKPAEDGSPALATMDGVPIITVDSLDREYNMLLEKNPQVKMLAQMMPNLKEQFFEGILASKIVDRCVAEKKLDKCPEYQQELDQLVEAVKQQLNKKYFGEQVPATVTTAEAKAFYEERKDVAPEILISQGGINTEGVEFEDENSAQAFMSQVLGKSNQFSEIVNKNDLRKNYRDFRLVNENSIGVDEKLRDAILNIDSFPTITTLKVDDKAWVINAKNKEEKKYRPFAELKDMIEDALQKQKQDEAERELIDQLKQKYNVDDGLGRDYFKQEGDQKASQVSLDDVGEDQFQVAESLEGETKPEVTRTA